MDPSAAGFSAALSGYQVWSSKVAAVHRGSPRYSGIFWPASFIAAGAVLRAMKRQRRPGHQYHIFGLQFEIFVMCINDSFLE